MIQIRNSQSDTLNILKLPQNFSPRFLKPGPNQPADFFFPALNIVFLLSFSFLIPCSEYQLARPSDSHRKEMLFGSLAKAGHPMGKFCWGKNNSTQSLCLFHRIASTSSAISIMKKARLNVLEYKYLKDIKYQLTTEHLSLSGNAQTLKHDPKEKQINTYQRLRHFWKRYYSAHYMTLTVQSKGTSANSSSLVY